MRATIIQRPDERFVGYDGGDLWGRGHCDVPYVAEAAVVAFLNGEEYEQLPEEPDSGFRLEHINPKPRTEARARPPSIRLLILLQNRGDQAGRQAGPFSVWTNSVFCPSGRYRSEPTRLIITSPESDDTFEDPHTR